MERLLLILMGTQPRPLSHQLSQLNFGLLIVLKHFRAFAFVFKKEEKNADIVTFGGTGGENKLHFHMHNMLPKRIQGKMLSFFNSVSFMPMKLNS